MNERIQELMEQAMELVDPYALEGEFGPRHLNGEKFAELLIRKCAKLSDDCPHSYLMQPYKYPSTYIKEHFGVE